jgi:hypothetical protein
VSLSELALDFDIEAIGYETALHKDLPADVERSSSGNTKASRQITIASVTCATPQPDDRAGSGTSRDLLRWDANVRGARFSGDKMI